MSKELESFEGTHCANCATPMQGEFCHHCGQSVHHVLKPMHHMFEDTLDIVLHVDARVLHTLPPLATRPGFLTLEYFAGRRQRYVAPFRLMFVLCLLAFFVCHFAQDHVGTGTDKPKVISFSSSNTGDYAQDANADAVRAHFAREQADIAQAMKKSPAIAQSGLQQAEELARTQANRRLVALGATPLPTEAPAAAASTSDVDNDDDHDDDNQPTEVHIGWLPDSINAQLTRNLQHINANWHAMRKDDEAGKAARERVIDGIYGALPQAMFVLMPLFALLLKLLYVFRRRLYMEHLIVALHSHAFLFLALLAGVLLALLRHWLLPHANWLASPFHWLMAALWLWAPVYLFLMQKRVYRQGWGMTTVKYLVTGCCYTVMLGFVLTAATLLGFMH